MDSSFVSGISLTVLPDLELVTDVKGFLSSRKEKTSDGLHRRDRVSNSLIKGKFFRELSVVLVIPTAAVSLLIYHETVVGDMASAQKIQSESLLHEV